MTNKKWHSNGNWGYPYRDWIAYDDHYFCNESGHRFFGCKVIVQCHGHAEFKVIPYKSSASELPNAQDNRAGQPPSVATSADDTRSG